MLAKSQLWGSAIVGIRSLDVNRKIRFVSCLFLLPLITSWVSAQTFEELSAQASAERDQNNPTRAIELYTQALQLNPKSSDAWWFLGSLQYQVGDYKPAITALSHYLGFLPDAAP